MNIFCTSEDPVQAARWLCDRHVVKMGTESCQMLANCFPHTILSQIACPKTQTGNARKHSHYAHPCSIWARRSKTNMRWLIEHTENIFEEKYNRYPKGGRHFCHDFLDWVKNNLKYALVPSGDLTTFAIAINDKCKCRAIGGFDSMTRIEQYRLYYIHDKSFATWKMNKPEWFIHK